MVAHYFCMSKQRTIREFVAMGFKVYRVGATDSNVEQGWTQFEVLIKSHSKKFTYVMRKMLIMQGLLEKTGVMCSNFIIKGTASPTVYIVEFRCLLMRNRPIVKESQNVGKSNKLV